MHLVLVKMDEDPSNVQSRVVMARSLVKYVEEISADRQCTKAETKL